jgi:hypothetical protein
MKQQNSKSILLAPATAAIVMFLIQPPQAEVLVSTGPGAARQRPRPLRPPSTDRLATAGAIFQWPCRPGASSRGY